MNLLDRVVAYVSPGRAEPAPPACLTGRLKRRNGGCGRFPRLHASGVTVEAQRSSPDSRPGQDLDKTHDIARGALTVLVDNIIGPGESASNRSLMTHRRNR